MACLCCAHVHVHVLASMCVYICICRYTEALKYYEDALLAQPTSAPLWKRKVAVYKAMGDTAKAVSELNALLNV